MDAPNPTTQTPSSQNSGTEPLSGAKGAGTASEPYDQGNAEGMVVSQYSTIEKRRECKETEE